MDTTTIASTWGTYVSETGYDDLPAAVTRRMKLSLLDSLGCIILGSRLENTRAITSYVASLGDRPEATVLPSGLRTSAALAAMVNGTSVHAIELAEVFSRATSYTGVMIPPVAFAVGEARGSHGRDVIVSMAVGSEIAIRTGLAVRVDPDSPTFAAKEEGRPSGPLGPNSFAHPAATFGLYGSVAVAARLDGLDPARVAHALTMSTALAPTVGLTSFREGSKVGALLEGASVKDLYLGHANEVAVRASGLAAHGLHGPSDVLGHLSSLVADVSPELLVRGLGEQHLVLSGGIRFHRMSVAGPANPAAFAAVELTDRRPVDVADIESIDVLIHDRGIRISADPDPQNRYAAVMSIPYVVSAVLTHADELRSDPHLTTLYDDHILQDPVRRDLAQRITCVAEPSFHTSYDVDWPMKFEAELQIHLRSGEVVVHRSDLHVPEEQLSDDVFVAKFTDLAGRVLDRNRVDEIVDLVLGLDRLDSLEPVAAAISAGLATPTPSGP